jgi:legumain
MVEEIASMQKLDAAFSKFDTKLTLNGNYDGENINFGCLRSTVDTYEQKCGKLSDYGLQFVRNFAEACQKHDLGTVLSSIAC